ncbi:energy transducer TonB [Agarivorans sp. Z349TD_8]|uniref:energy transducer TonB n=1 Tax=Agarivorans sp. Z349TD_8 TaxID=3421434 RepID=UPI003D7D67D6
MNVRCSVFTRFVLLSLLIHCIVAIWVYFQPQEKLILAKKTNTLKISVGLQAAMMGVNIVTPASTAKTKVEPVIEMDEPEPEPEPVKKALSQQKPKEQLPKKHKPKPKKEINRPVKKKIETRKLEAKTLPKKNKVLPSPEVLAQKSDGAQGVEGSKHDNHLQKETGSGEQAGGIVNEAQFDFYIRQHLLAKKITPRLLKSGRKKGVVVIVFTLDRLGNIMHYKIAKPSRVREFDRAAIKLVRKAEPFPKAPDFVTWQQRKYSIDISYSVK